MLAVNPGFAPEGRREEAATSLRRTCAMSEDPGPAHSLRSAYDHLRRVKGARPAGPGALPALDPAAAGSERRQAR